MVNLIKISKLFKKQNITTEEQNITIDANKLLEYIKNVEETKKDYNTDGIEIKWIDEKNVVDVNVEGIIKGDLNIELTKVREIKAKKVLGDINAYGVKTLKKIEVEEEIGGDLDIRGTNIDFQKKIIDQIENGKLKINGERYFGRDIEGIEQLCNDKNLIIPGNLDIIRTRVKEINLKKVLGDIWANGVTTLKKIEVTEGIEGNLKIRGTSIEFQKKVLEKKKNGKLKINGEIFYDILIDAEELKKYIKNVENGENIPNIHGITITKNKENDKIVLDVNVEEIINGNLDISGTNIEKIKVKKVLGGINAYGVKTLKKIEVEEEIGGYLDIIGTNIDFQLGIIKKMENYELKINGDISFGGDIEGIEQLCNNENLTIPGNLYISGTNVKKIKAKKVLGDINAEGVKTLEEIEIKEWITGNLNIKGTSVKTITIQKAKGDINVNQVETLEEINVEKEIIGDLDIRGTRVKKITAQEIRGNVYAEGVTTLEEINVEDSINGNLDISGTNVKKIETKYIGGDINANQVETLEEINVEKEIIGDLDIRGTRVKKITTQRIRGNVYAEGVKTLKEIEVTQKIDRNLDIRGTSVKKIETKYIRGDINAEGVETLEEINVEKVLGDLDIRGTRVDFQKKVLEKKKNGELKINGRIFYDDEEID